MIIIQVRGGSKTHRVVLVDAAIGKLWRCAACCECCAGFAAAVHWFFNFSYPWLERVISHTTHHRSPPDTLRIFSLITQKRSWSRGKLEDPLCGLFVRVFKFNRMGVCARATRWDAIRHQTSCSTHGRWNKSARSDTRDRASSKRLAVPALTKLGYGGGKRDGGRQYVERQAKPSIKTRFMLDKDRMSIQTKRMEPGEKYEGRDR